MATRLNTYSTLRGALRTIYYCAEHAPSGAMLSGPVLGTCEFQRRDERCIKKSGHAGLHYCERTT
jgi:hypothetical protein